MGPILTSNNREDVAIFVIGAAASALIAYAKRPKPKKIGPMPTGRRWKGMPVPFFFQAPTAEAFSALDTRDDDVIMSSLGKGGTTWVHKILHLLLHGVDDDGHLSAATQGIGATAQVYPEAIVLRRGADADPANPPGMAAVRTKFFGEWGFEDDMCGQPSPRLISTHLYGAHLPAQLIAPDGKGKLVVVLRNLKDTLSSLHFFQGEAKDGWLGNEHGPGSLARFIHPDSPNAYGSPFEFVKQNDAVVRALAPSGRVLVVYYEDLIRSLPAHVARIAAFLNISLSEQKRDAVVRAAGFGAMKASGGMANVLLRKGGIGDWRNHMAPAEWARFDGAFEAALGTVALAEPLRYYQLGEVEGMPRPREKQTLADDPRTWPRFVRKTLVDGRLVRDTLIASDPTGAFVRPPSEYKGVVMPPGTRGARHVAEAGRYHLFVSGVCPWATSTRAARHVLGLEAIISMDVADGQSGGGWVLLSGTSCPPWDGRAGPFFIHEVYQASEPLGTTRITVPILWDKQRACIVSNDSWAILKMLATAFKALGTRADDTPAPELLPPSLLHAIEEAHSRLYDRLLNGVYKAGIGLLKGNTGAHAAAATLVYATLDELEGQLANARFLMGTPHPTAVDLRLAMTLLRYDCAYVCAFGLRAGKGGILVDSAYPNLQGYVRDMYQHLAPAIEFRAFRQYYRWGPGLQPHEPLPDVARIVAAAEAAHGRERMK